MALCSTCRTGRWDCAQPCSEANYGSLPAILGERASLLSQIVVCGARALWRGENRESPPITFLGRSVSAYGERVHMNLGSDPGGHNGGELYEVDSRLISPVPVLLSRPRFTFRWPFKCAFVFWDYYGSECLCRFSASNLGGGGTDRVAS
jgi:hypothetical protein